MTTINRRAFNQLIEENLAWLMQQPRSLERDHIECIVRHSTAMIYDDKCSCGRTRHHDEWESRVNPKRKVCIDGLNPDACGSAPDCGCNK